MKRLRVRRVEVATVVPAEATQPHSLFLSCFDIQMWHLPYMKRILLYPPHSHHTSFSATVSRLRSSLAETLVLFYPYAGRLSERHVGRRPTLECNDAGVQFSAAEAGVCVEDLGPELHPDPDLFPQLIDCGTTTRLSHLPLLYIQVTRFVCGGISVGLAYNQVVSDAVAFWTFVKTWCQVCAKGAAATTKVCGLPPPVHTRDLLRVTDLTTQVDSSQFHPSLYSFVDPWKSRRRKEGGDASGQQAASPASPLMLEEEEVQRIFIFSPESIQKLKVLARFQIGGAKAKQSETDVKVNGERKDHFTSFEVLGAHLWRCISKARRCGQWCHTQFVIESDCRSRLPFLPECYFGNATCCTAAVSTVTQVVDEPIRFAAKLIRKARSKSLCETYIRMLIHYSEQHGNVRPPNASTTSNHRHTTVIHNLADVPLYECDLGWGKPVGVRSGNLEEHVIFPHPAGGAEVGISLPAGAMARLLQDASFLP